MTFSLSAPGRLFIFLRSDHVDLADPAELSILDLRYLSDYLDLGILARYLQCVDTPAETQHLALFMKPNGSLIARCSCHGLQTAKMHACEEMRVVLLASQEHLCLTYRKKRAVVNQRLVVHGTSILRVVDASVSNTKVHYLCFVYGWWRQD